ncbi:MAG: hypothetical protein ABIH78_00845 [Candidatus Peregrinibacteria bacterium]
MKNKNKLFQHFLAILALAVMTTLVGQNIVFAQEAPPEIGAPAFGDEDEPPSLTGTEPEAGEEDQPPALTGPAASICTFAPTGADYNVGQSFLYDNQTCECTSDGIVCAYTDEPTPTPSPTPIIIETGPAMGLLAVPSLILGWMYNRKRQK